MKKKELKERIVEIVNGMTKLEVEMAQTSFYNKGATLDDVIKWVNTSTKLSSKLDKIYKELK
jgi:hypothetical protein